MHFNSSFLAIVKCVMPESIRRNIYTELPVDSCNEVQVEPGSYAFSVIICPLYYLRILFKISAYCECFPPAQNFSATCDKRPLIGRFHVSYCRTQEDYGLPTRHLD